MPSPPPLAPLAGTGFSLFPDQTAQQSTTFLMKEHFSLARLRLDITTNGVLAFTAAEEKRNQYVFRTPSGEEVMRIAKDPHSWSGRGEEFHGLRPDGREVWTCKLRRKLSGTEYCLTIYPDGYAAQTLLVQKKTNGVDFAVLLDGHTLVSMTHKEPWKHVRREDVFNVAGGVDMLLALGMCFVRYDKQATDAKIAASAAA